MGMIRSDLHLLHCVSVCRVFGWGGLVCRGSFACFLGGERLVTREYPRLRTPVCLSVCLCVYAFVCRADWAGGLGVRVKYSGMKSYVGLSVWGWIHRLLTPMCLYVGWGDLILTHGEYCLLSPHFSVVCLLAKFAHRRVSGLGVRSSAMTAISSHSPLLCRFPPFRRHIREVRGITNDDDSKVCRVGMVVCLQLPC